MFAEDAAPIKVTKTTRPVYLPKGTAWVDFWTGKSYNGGQTINANATIETMPLFVRAGSIIPMAKVKNYALESPDDTLEIRVYQGADGEFTLYEDENDGYNYEKGICATIEFEWDNDDKTLTIDERKGTFPGMLQSRVFNIVLVSENNGVGLPITKNVSKTITYKGSEVTVKLAK
jgi:alpha-D-xyloside xylohydrolase